jgi:hypothetical protein
MPSDQSHATNSFQITNHRPTRTQSPRDASAQTKPQPDNRGQVRISLAKWQLSSRPTCQPQRARSAPRPPSWPGSGRPRPSPWSRSAARRFKLKEVSEEPQAGSKGRGAEAMLTRSTMMPARPAAICLACASARDKEGMVKYNRLIGERWGVGLGLRLSGWGIERTTIS